ncbi:MAG: MFS transporter [Spirochaetaceae bacterium]|jgi:MFS family permease|nr:MFS transporter [Spirochaetaceae bacterium]
MQGFGKDIYRPDAKAGRFLGVLALCGISYGLYRGIQDNYLAEIVGITAFERGIVEFFREMPGLLVVFILAGMYRFTESRIFKIGVAVMAAGLIGLLAAGTGKITVVLGMVLFSFGEHIIMPVRTTLSLALAFRERSGAALGVTSALGHLGNIAGYAAVTALFFLFSRIGFSRKDVLPFRIIFGIGAALMIGGVLTVLALQETSLKGPRRRFYFARKFHKYYMLEVFYGARKQIFLTFAPYVLILQYRADTSVIAFLLALCAGFGLIFSPIMGRLIDRLGFKRIMVADTLLLVIVCLLYGFAHRLFPFSVAFIVVCVNYVLDSIISLASMASNVYVQALAADPEEITATLSTGVSVNHGISIFIALMGGWIWKVTGLETLFTLSAVLGLLNSLYAASIKLEKS